MNNETIKEPLLHSLMKIESLLLEVIRLLDNCPFREETWTKRQINNFMKELDRIQSEIKQDVFQ
jgi:hypothetical protein